MVSRMVMYKLVMLGDGGVGKTALMMQMLLRFFVETYDPTTEDQFRQQVVVDGQSCMMDVLDTGGTMKQTALIDQWIRDGEGFVLVYSISSRSSFTRIKELHHHIQRLKEPFTSSARQASSATSLQPPMPIILVGNKCDIDTGRTVSVEEGYALARELGCRFVEASAKNNINVEAAFLDVVRILQRGRQQALRQATSSSDRLSQRRAAISRSVSDVRAEDPRNNKDPPNKPPLKSMSGSHHDLVPEELPKSSRWQEAGSFWPTWRALCWYKLMQILEPLPKGAQRVTYTCGCGDLCYLDVVEMAPGGAAELQEHLNADARTVRLRSNTQTVSSSPPSSPQPARISPSSQSHDQRRRPIQSLPQLRSNEHNGGTDTTSVQRLTKSNRTSEPRYLLLCVNTRRDLALMEHIEVSSMTNDQYLFQDIQSEYSRMRRNQQWNLGMVFPNDIRIPNWILRILCIPAPRHIQFPAWLGKRLENCRIFIPKKAEFVQFQLIPAGTDICADIVAKPAIPGDEEVLVKKSYEYRPVPLKVKILRIPLHDLLKPGPHLGSFWLNRFPKKRGDMLTWDESQECLGWGIHIIEGWNKRLVVFVVLLLMLIFGIFVALYSVITHDGSTGAGIGSFLAGLLTLYCWLRYEEWKSE